MSIRPPRGRVLAALTLLALLPLPAVGQSQDRPPVFSSRVELVRLHVTVRDGDEFVSGLSLGDFRLLIDDEERVPAWVEEIDLTDAEPTSAERALHARRRFVIFIDAVFQHPAKLEVCKKAALEFVDRMARPGDLVALAAAGYRGISLLEPFTTDHVAIHAAIEAIGPDRPVWGARTFMPLADRQYLPLPPRVPAGIATGRELLPELIAEHRHTYVDLMGLYLSGLHELARGLQALDGRKHLLLYSPGLSSSSLGLSSLPALRARAPDTPLVTEIDYSRQALRDLFFMATEALRDADTAVHAMSTSRMRMVGNRVGMHSIWYLSDETKGSMQFHTHHLEKATARVNERTARYYTLAYRRRPDDGERATIEVRVTRDDIEVEAPTRLVIPPIRARMSPLQLRLKEAEERAVRASGHPSVR